MSKLKQKYRPNVRKIFEEKYGEIDSGKEIHHILPIRLGGTDSLENLVALTREEHKLAHLELYEKYKDFRDLCAYHMIGFNFSEAHFLSSSEGGKKAIRKFKEEGYPEDFGFQNLTREHQKELAVQGGKRGGRIQFENKIGIHTQTHEERLILASLGGIKSCETNGWRESKVQSDNGKRGGVKNKGFKWYTDGVSDFKYTPFQQLDTPFNEFLDKNTQFYPGRKK